MFLDPDPKRQKQTASGLFVPQSPVSSPQELRPTTAKRRPLLERTKSQSNTQAPRSNPVRTVRLVPASPSSPALSSNSEDAGGKENRSFVPQGKVASLLPQFGVSEGGNSPKPVFPSAGGYSVSEKPRSAIKALRADTLDQATLHPADLHLKNEEAQWGVVRAGSDTYSQSSTLNLNESDTSIHTSGQAKDPRISVSTTLRGSPSLDEKIDRPVSASSMGQPEQETTVVVHDSSRPSTNSSAEESAGRPATARPIAASAFEPSVLLTPTHVRFPRYHHATSDSDVASTNAFSSPGRRSSTGAADPSSIGRIGRPNAALGFYPSRDSLYSEGSMPAASSPNFVAFSSSPMRPRSRSHPLSYARSFESITSRLERTPARPGTGRSATDRSVFTNSSYDTLPPLSVPKKRLRHMHASQHAPLNASFSSQGSSDDVHGPYSRHQFSRHLSTIASESERGASQQLSQLSLGSELSSDDDLPDSVTWAQSSYGGMRELARSCSAPVAATGDETGDVTMNIYRDASLVPRPLFRESMLPVPPPHAYIHPLSSSLRISEYDEHDDTLSALHAPALRQKRSGYSIRNRSNSALTYASLASMASPGDNNRWSNASVIFPTWARHYYSGSAALSSKVSLSSIGSFRARPELQSRDGSAWTEPSAISRVNTNQSVIVSPAAVPSPMVASPASSAFLPSIFRPRNRARQRQETPVRTFKFRRSPPSATISPDSRTDTKSSPPDPLNSHPMSSEPMSAQTDLDEVLPSGHPRWGTLKDDTPTHRPLRRIFSRQKEWYTMPQPQPETPRDSVADLVVPPPHLVPSRREETPATWRPPSFVESLDTLVHSRANRQILLFCLGFLCPLLWMVGAVLPLPARPLSDEETLGLPPSDSIEGDVERAIIKHEVGDTAERWVEEQSYLRGRWWRMLNRVMSVVGVLVITAVIALAVVATH